MCTVAVVIPRSFEFLWISSAVEAGKETKFGTKVA